MIKVGIIGCGQWGPNHVRNFSHLAGSRAIMCADLDTSRLKVMKDTFRNIIPTRDYKNILRNPAIDAVVISTPTSTHYRFVKEALEAGKDVLCEKPLCLSVKEGDVLRRLAKKKRRILMVGHVFLFNPGIRKLKELLERKSCGRLYYMHSERTNLGPFRSDVNAAWDLASHDISIFDFFLNDSPREVSAVGGCYLQKKIEDVAFLSLRYPSGVLANVHVSWLDPKKVREITVVGGKKMLIWDDLNMEGSVKIYDRKAVPRYYETFGEFQLQAKEGDIVIPKVEMYEPLKAQDAHFLDCIRTRRKPLSDAEFALQVVKTLAAAKKSLAAGGAFIKV